MNEQDDILNFTIEIEKIVAQKRTSWMDAVILYCEKTGLELDLVSKLISGPIKARIREEAEALHFLPKSKTTELPI